MYKGKLREVQLKCPSLEGGAPKEDLVQSAPPCGINVNPEREGPATVGFGGPTDNSSVNEATLLRARSRSETIRAQPLSTTRGDFSNDYSSDYGSNRSWHWLFHSAAFQRIWR